MVLIGDNCWGSSAGNEMLGKMCWGLCADLGWVLMKLDVLVEDECYQGLKESTVTSRLLKRCTFHDHCNKGTLEEQ